MPYDPNNPPSKTKNLSAKKRRQWVHVLNSSLERGDEEDVAHRKAWGAVKNSNYRTAISTSGSAMNTDNRSKPVEQVVRSIKQANRVKRSAYVRAVMNARVKLAAQPGAFQRIGMPAPAAAAGLGGGLYAGRGTSDAGPTKAEGSALAEGDIFDVLRDAWPLLAAGGGAVGLTTQLADADQHGSMLRYLPWLAALGGGLYGLNKQLSPAAGQAEPPKTPAPASKAAAIRPHVKKAAPAWVNSLRGLGSTVAHKGRTAAYRGINAVKQHGPPALRSLEQAAIANPKRTGALAGLGAVGAMSPAAFGAAAPPTSSVGEAISNVPPTLPQLSDFLFRYAPHLLTGIGGAGLLTSALTGDEDSSPWRYLPWLLATGAGLGMLSPHTTNTVLQQAKNLGSRAGDMAGQVLSMYGAK